VVQLVKHLTLDFGSGHDLRVVRSSPALGSVLAVGPAWDSLSAPPPLLSLSLSFAKKIFKMFKKIRYRTKMVNAFL